MEESQKSGEVEEISEKLQRLPTIRQEEKLKEHNKLIADGKSFAKHGNIQKALELFKLAYNIHQTPNLKIETSKIEELQVRKVDKIEANEFVDVNNSGLLLFKKLHDKLYDYQRDGVSFLYSLYRDSRKGGILADDMGLGKTVQIISFLSGMYEHKIVKHTLLVMPTSLITNWVKEFAEWTPGIRVMEFHGTSKPERTRNLEKVQRRSGVVITTYTMLVYNWQQLSSFQGKEFIWDYVILDEAHTIKNTSTKTAKSAYAIPSKNRILLTGTPVQNNLREMWTLFDFACQGALLGTAKTFKTEYENPITRAREKDATPGERALGSRMSENLMTLIKPYFLRRTKSEVQKTLQSQKESADNEDIKVQNNPVNSRAVMPKLTRKNDLIVWTYLSRIQEDIYRDFISLDHIKELLLTTRSPLTELTILKKLCDHPRLLSPGAISKLGLEANGVSDSQGESTESDINTIANTPDDTLISESGKLVFLLALLERLREEGHRTLVFAHYRKVLDIIQRILGNRGFKMLRLDGTMSQIKRQTLISLFQKDQSYSVFLLTTQVGGVGITLTAADRVVIYDPSLNPATDAQAVDRAYRIGQRKNVIIYRLITCGTVEEKIYRRQVFKDSLIRQNTGDKKNPFRYFSKQELRELFTLEDTRSSTTQLQLQRIHSRHRQTDPELDEHIAHLHTMEMFGISDHDLMFSLDANHDEDLESQEEKQTIEDRVQRAQEMMRAESELKVNKAPHKEPALMGQVKNNNPKKSCVTKTEPCPVRLQPGSFLPATDDDKTPKPSDFGEESQQNQTNQCGSEGQNQQFNVPFGCKEVSHQTSQSGSGEQSISKDYSQNNSRPVDDAPADVSDGGPMDMSHTSQATVPSGDEDSLLQNTSGSFKHTSNVSQMSSPDSESDDALEDTDSEEEKLLLTKLQMNGTFDVNKSLSEDQHRQTDVTCETSDGDDSVVVTRKKRGTGIYNKVEDGEELKNSELDECFQVLVASTPKSPASGSPNHQSRRSQSNDSINLSTRFSLQQNSEDADPEAVDISLGQLKDIFGISPASKHDNSLLHVASRNFKKKPNESLVSEMDPNLNPPSVSRKVSVLQQSNCSSNAETSTMSSDQDILLGNLPSLLEGSRRDDAVEVTDSEEEQKPLSQFQINNTCYVSKSMSEVMDKGTNNSRETSDLRNSRNESIVVTEKIEAALMFDSEEEKHKEPENGHFTDPSQTFEALSIVPANCSSLHVESLLQNTSGSFKHTSNKSCYLSFVKSSPDSESDDALEDTDSEEVEKLQTKIQINSTFDINKSQSENLHRQTDVTCETSDRDDSVVVTRKKRGTGIYDNVEDEEEELQDSKLDECVQVLGASTPKSPASGSPNHQSRRSQSNDSINLSTRFSLQQNSEDADREAEDISLGQLKDIFGKSPASKHDNSLLHVASRNFKKKPNESLLSEMDPNLNPPSVSRKVSVLQQSNCSSSAETSTMSSDQDILLGNLPSLLEGSRRDDAVEVTDSVVEQKPVSQLQINNTFYVNKSMSEVMDKGTNNSCETSDLGNSKNESIVVTEKTGVAVMCDSEEEEHKEQQNGQFTDPSQTFEALSIVPENCSSLHVESLLQNATGNFNDIPNVGSQSEIDLSLILLSVEILKQSNCSSNAEKSKVNFDQYFLEGGFNLQLEDSESDDALEDRESIEEEKLLTQLQMNGTFDVNKSFSGNLRRQSTIACETSDSDESRNESVVVPENIGASVKYESEGEDDKEQHNSEFSYSCQVLEISKPMSSTCASPNQLSRRSQDETVFMISFLQSTLEDLHIQRDSEEVDSNQNEQTDENLYFNQSHSQILNSQQRQVNQFGSGEESHPNHSKCFVDLNTNLSDQENSKPANTGEDKPGTSQIAESSCDEDMLQSVPGGLIDTPDGNSQSEMDITLIPQSMAIFQQFSNSCNAESSKMSSDQYSLEENVNSQLKGSREVVLENADFEKKEPKLISTFQMNSSFNINKSLSEDLHKQTTNCCETLNPNKSVNESLGVTKKMITAVMHDGEEEFEQLKDEKNYFSISVESLKVSTSTPAASVFSHHQSRRSEGENIFVFSPFQCTMEDLDYHEDTDKDEHYQSQQMGKHLCTNQSDSPNTNRQQTKMNQSEQGEEKHQDQSSGFIDLSTKLSLQQYSEDADAGAVDISPGRLNDLIGTSQVAQYSAHDNSLVHVDPRNVKRKPNASFLSEMDTSLIPPSINRKVSVLQQSNCSLNAETSRMSFGQVTPKEKFYSPLDESRRDDVVEVADTEAEQKIQINSSFDFNKSLSEIKQKQTTVRCETPDLGASRNESIVITKKIEATVMCESEEGEHKEQENGQFTGSSQELGDFATVLANWASLHVKSLPQNTPGSVKNIPNVSSHSKSDLGLILPSVEILKYSNCSSNAEKSKVNLDQSSLEGGFNLQLEDSESDDALEETDSENFKEQSAFAAVAASCRSRYLGSKYIPEDTDIKGVTRGKHDPNEWGSLEMTIGIERSGVPLRDPRDVKENSEGDKTRSIRKPRRRRVRKRRAKRRAGRKKYFK